MPAYREDDDRWLTFGLAFVGGYCDASGFVLGSTFTGHVTGNLVLVAIAAVARDERSVLRNLAALLTFLLGVTLTAVTAGRLNPTRTLRTVMMVEVVLLTVASFVAAASFNHAIAAFLACVALAMGLQNGAFRHAGGISVHTTYLTGMITAFISGAARASDTPSMNQRTLTPESHSGILGGIWASFVLGGAAGAGMTFRFRGFGILGAALVLLLLAVHLLVATE